MKSRKNRPDARSLTRRAGHAVRETHFEPLEQRKLLFSITITPDSDFDGDGVGSVSAQFGYMLPYLDTAVEVELDDDPEAIDEDFNDAPVGPVPNGFVFDDSDIRVTHNFGFSPNFRIAEVVPGEDGELELDITARDGSFWTFEPWAVEDDGTLISRLSAVQASFLITGGDDSEGLLPNDFTVELLFLDEVIASYTGADLIAQNTSGNNNDRLNGVGTFVFDAADVPDQRAFTGIRVISSTGENLNLDNLQFLQTTGSYQEIIEEHIFGAEITFTGPVGASVEIFDLYGRPMQRTLALGAPDGLDINLVDLDDDGVPNFNDGIGRIVFRGTDSRANFAMVGGTIEFEDDTGFTFTQVDSFTGLYDDFESAGFGYYAEYGDDGEPTIYGLPAGPGSVVVGSPFLRDPTNTQTYAPEDVAPSGPVVDSDFNRADQGLFVLNGSDMGEVYIHGIVHGSSRFSGALEDMYVGYLVGTVTVDGDLGSLYVGSEAGFWISDEDAANAIVQSTGAEIVVGRTLGEFSVAGRSAIDVTVLGDLNAPSLRPPGDMFRYTERESMYLLDPGTDNPEAAILRANLFSPVDLVGNDSFYAFPQRRSPIYVDSTYRNDTIGGAEFIGSAASSVEVRGDIGFGDPINGAEDPSDVFAFAVDGQREVDIQINSETLGYVRVLDQNGVPIAATVFEDFADGSTFFSQFLRFTAPSAGVYYLEITDLGAGFVDGTFDSGWSYVATISGLAPLTFGSYRTGGSSGVRANPFPLTPTIQTLTGSFGIARAGMGYTGTDSEEQDTTAIMNRPQEDAENSADLVASTFVSAGDMYAMVAGSDMEFADIYVAGDLAGFYSGMSPAFGLTGDGLQGDVYGVTVQVDGRIGTVDIKGGVGLDNDGDGVAFVAGIGLDLRTGLDGGDGSIGWIRIGGDVNGGTLFLNTSSGSTVGSLLVSQDREDVFTSGIYGGFFLTNDFRLGAGSDLRFADFPRIDNLNTVDQNFELFVGQAVEFVDDSGGIVRVEVQGPVPGALVGAVRVLPLDNGQGVAIARIDGLGENSGLDLSGGRTLRITSTGRLFGDNSDEAPISIGRIAIQNADAQSQVVIDGAIEIDVWQITSAAALGTIRNSTPGGDIVAVDVNGLGSLQIEDGNLGRTQTASYGPTSYGPLLGIAPSEDTAVGGALGVSEESLGIDDGIEEGFRPVGSLENIYLEDIGAPIDPYLNGLVVRSGDIGSVLVSGAIGHVVLQGGGTIQSVVADSDFIPGVGQIDGIFGTVYGFVIDNVDVGQGLISNAVAPFVDAGIFAGDEIRLVRVDTTLHEGAFLSGVVIASDSLAGSGPPGEPDVGGIESIRIERAVVRDAYIGAMNIDAFLTSYLGVGEQYRGTIGEIGGTELTLFRSRVEALDLDRLSLGRGTYDATVTNVSRRAGDIDLRVAQNSTIGGGVFEFALNRITVGGSVGDFIAGDVSDLSFEAVGVVDGQIQADNWRRVNFVVNGTVPSITINQQLLASRISVGDLGTLAAQAIRSSEIEAAGQIGSVTSATEIFNTSIASTGKQGRIGTVTAASRIVGSIAASGPIGSISTTTGDIDIELTTTTDRGTVGTLSAARDLVLDSSISAGVGTISAGRNIGLPGGGGLIFVKADLTNINAGGHLYNDVRVGGSLTSATIGRAVNRPGQPMARSGSFFVAEEIQSIAVTGDYGGSVVSYTNGVQSLTITGGSLLPTGRVEAYGGDIESLVITGGNLYGDLYTDRSIRSVVIEASPDGVFGDVGVNPAFSAGVGYDAYRGQLPPGIQQTAGKDGPNIVAEIDIDSFVVTGGNVYEATIFAGQTLGSLEVTGRIISDFTPGNTGRSIIAAGDEITSIVATSNVNRAVILAGVRSLGDDLDVGGFGSNADTTQSGRIVGITVGGNMTNTQVAAGTNAGSDRVYNTPDDLLEIGISSVGTITIAGNADGSSVYSDRLLAGARAGGKLAWGGPFRPVNNGDIATSTTGTQLPKGSNFAFSTGASEGFIRFTGPGNAFWDASNSRVILSGTNGLSTLLVRAGGDRNLTDFDIVSTEGASMGRIRVEAFRLLGDSDIVIDENVDRMELGQIAGTGTIQAGARLASFASGDFRSGELIARDAGSLFISGQLGDADRNVRGEVLLSTVTLESLRVAGEMQGDVSSRYSINTVNMPAGMVGGLIRSGGTIGAINADSLFRSRISAGRGLQNLSVSGDMFDSAVLVGGDLGDDAEIGGAGFAGDSVGVGSIGTVNVGGDFVQSDIVAGYLRGPDGFFGTQDDLLASGRSSIGSVTIGGDAEGSNLFSESYRIASTGSLGAVTAGGQPLRSEGNMVVETERLDPLPVQIVELDTRRDGGDVVADLTFNQPIDFSSLSRALSVSEVRGVGEIEIRLIEGVDYTLEYNPQTETVSVIFSRSVIEQDLPVVGDQPKAGVYRFDIEAEFIRAKAVQAELDGDGDGRVEGDNDDYARQNIIGDAGDKLSSESFTIPGRNGLPDRQVDLYGPLNLDIVLDDVQRSDGLPDTNQTFTIRGAIGDHPDNDPDFFSFSSDSDVYAITLQAGQILKLGAMQGPAQFAGRFLVQPDGNVLNFSSDFALRLPIEPLSFENRDLTQPEDFLIRQTGTYHIVVANSIAGLVPGLLPDIAPAPGGVGSYDFTINVFDDGDSGFNAETNSGDGQDLVNAPAPAAFAGNDGVLGTADDRASIVIGAYRFTFNAGPDGVAGTTDDFVSGSNGNNVSSMTDTLGVSTVSVDAAIGTPGSTGVPDLFFPDVDVFHLNNGNRISTGSVIRATLQTSELGSDLGSFVGTPDQPLLVDSYVEFAIFDTSNSDQSDDGVLLFAPSDVRPSGGAIGVLAESNNVTYGFDENGDFYIEFVAPGQVGRPGANASYALYVQGVLNTDYRLEVVTGGSRELVQRRQNFLIETRGGNVDWIEVGGRITPLEGFDASALGFTGRADNGQRIDDYIIDRVTDIVQDTFDGVITGAGSDGVFGTADDERGLDVNISANPGDFDFQDFSTIFLSTTFDPRDPLFTPIPFASLLAFDVDTPFFSPTYAVSQHSDPGNADLTDDAVVFLHNLSGLDYTPSAADLESFIQSLAAVTARRAGELMGLRFTTAFDPTQDVYDVQATNSANDTPGDSGQYEFVRGDRRLSAPAPADTVDDTDFFLGYQNSAALLSLYTRNG